MKLIENTAANMRTHAEKSVENKSQAAPESGALSFSDKRPEAFTQLKMQDKADNSPQAKRIFQLQSLSNNGGSFPIQRKPNNTGLPDSLKSGMENISGHSLDDVKVYYNSSKPAQLNAHAYAQGTDIHLAPKQEKHLAHEAWHVVQQKQGRVKATKQLKSKVNINDDAALEREADIMGAKAMSAVAQRVEILKDSAYVSPRSGPRPNIVQRQVNWFHSLLELAKAHPLITSALVGAAGLVAYYYWNRQPRVPQQVQQAMAHPPGRDTLEGVAEQINVAPAVLLNQLENGVGNIQINDFYAVDLLPWQGGAITGAVPPTLIANLPQAPAAKVQTIFNRLNAWPFVYTGQRSNGVAGFLSRQGDCYTLAAMLVLAADAAGVPGVTIQSVMTPMLVAPRAIHGRATQYNVNPGGEHFWYFVEHHWCVFQGQAYDVLFMHQGQIPSFHSNGTLNVGQQHYTLFPNGMAFSTQGEAEGIQGTVVRTDTLH